MFGWRKSIVYCSKDKADWEKADTLLAGAGIEKESWHSPEPTLAGCGAKVDIRTFAKRGQIPKEIYKIEVASVDKEKAEHVLEGKVQPVRYYGVG